jgi:hypothetical protein
MQISSVNGQSLNGDSTDILALYSKVEHQPIYGTGSSRCTSGTEFIYDGGLMVTNTRGDYLKYRAYYFKNKAEQAAAKLDNRNAGLPYAKIFGDANGCSAEVVYEFTPASGGGLAVGVCATTVEWTYEGEQRLRDASALYDAGDEIVVQVKTEALRQSQNLASDTACDTGYTDFFRFSKNFICKSTGVSVAASSISWANVLDQWSTTISTDPSNPSLFQTEPYSPNDGWASGGGHSKSLCMLVTLDAAAAPESCGTMYWDPLVQVVPGDGNSFGLKVEGSGELKDGNGPGGADGGGGDDTAVVVVVAVLATACVGAAVGLAVRSGNLPCGGQGKPHRHHQAAGNEKHTKVAAQEPAAMAELAVLPPTPAAAEAEA